MLRPLVGNCSSGSRQYYSIAPSSPGIQGNGTNTTSGLAKTEEAYLCPKNGDIERWVGFPGILNKLCESIRTGTSPVGARPLMELRRDDVDFEHEGYLELKC